MSSNTPTATMCRSILHPDAANLARIAVVHHVADAVSGSTETHDTPIVVQGVPLTASEMGYPPTPTF